MRNITDQAYLRESQYQNALNLDARVALHALFSTNPYGWQRWLFEQIPLAQGQSVLELGCGAGHLWSQNTERIPTNLDLTLSDLSSGMLEDAQKRLAPLSDVQYEVIDAQQIPYPPHTFHVVIANHMLYHVPDLHAALAEIRRVLKPRGCFCASTVGANHMAELAELVRRFDPALPAALIHPSVGFTLQNGAAELAKHFNRIDRFSYDDALEITQALPLVAYVASTADAILAGERLPEFTSFIEAELAARGSILVTKESGVFICWN